MRLFIIFAFLISAWSTPGSTALALDAPVSDGDRNANPFLATPLKAVLFPFRQAVIAAGVPSTLIRQHFREGEAFPDRALLVELDDRSYRQLLEVSKKNEQENNHRLQFAQKELDRIDKLHKDRIAGDHQLAQARLDLEIARLRLHKSQAETTLAALDHERCAVTAPFAGRLVQYHAREHEFVQAGQPVVEIIDDSRLLAVLHIPSNLRTRIRPSMKARIRIEETGQEHSGTIHSISAEIDPGSRSFQIKLLLDNPDGQMSAGMSGIVTTWITDDESD